MKSRQKLITLTAWMIGGVAACAVPSIVPADEPSTQPAPAPTKADAMATPTTLPATATQPVSAEQINQQLRDVFQGISKYFDPRLLMTAAGRAEAKTVAVPQLRKAQALGDQLAATGPDAKEDVDQVHQITRQFLLLMGEADARTETQKLTTSGDAEIAMRAKCQLVMADWVQSAPDAAAQTKALEAAEALAKADPKSNEVTNLLASLSQLSPPTPELGKRAMDAAAAMQSDFAGQLKEQAQAAAKLAAFENKPITIAGKTVDGKDFTTADWKGKVVLVDFWATWCPPCRAELPRVKKVYADFHDKGLEVLGVSNDQTADDLKKFIAAPDAAMPWPQLFDTAAAAKGEWNPITTGYGIDGIPTMFLIDKKGICRTVNAREDFEAQVPKLLAE